MLRTNLFLSMIYFRANLCCRHINPKGVTGRNLCERALRPLDGCDMMAWFSTGGETASTWVVKLQEHAGEIGPR